MAHRTKKISTVSVVTVSLNCADSISITLDSVAGQTCRNVEHIVIDGVSTDGTVDIVNRSRVGYFVSEPDGGIYQAMEKGVKATSGDVLIFLNCGDTFYDDKVCEDVLAFFNETGADVVFGDFLPYLTDSKVDFDHSHFTPDKICKNDDVTDRMCLQHRNIHHQAVFYRRYIFDKCSYFSDECPQGSDYELNVQALVQHGFDAKYFPYPVSKFALGGLSTSDFRREEVEVGKLIDMIRRKYFNTPLHFTKDEYVYKPTASQPGLGKRLMKMSSPYRLMRPLIQRVVAHLGGVVRSELIRQGLTEEALRDFRLRSDSIFQVATEQRDALLEMRAAVEAGESNLQKRNDRASEITAEERLVLHQLPKLLDKLQSCAEAQRAFVEAGFGDLQSRTDSIYQVTSDQNRVLPEWSKNATKMIGQVQCSLDRLQECAGVNLARLLNAQSATVRDPSEAGYKISSQFDEDGIIQHLIRNVDIQNRIFIEFGVESYSEANTRLLVQKDNWAGLIIDSNEEFVSQIKRIALYWQHDLRALAAFVTRENINELISSAGIEGDIGLLSIDIDGMDYWVWESIDVVSPRIVICEYNAIFGPDAAIVVPYRSDFDRTKAHYSNLYLGASLAALELLANRKGYSLVASNGAGNNAFFVRNDCLGDLRARTAQEAYVRARFRESRDPEGKLTFLPLEKGIELIGDLPVVDVASNRRLAIKEAEIRV